MIPRWAFLFFLGSLSFSHAQDFGKNRLLTRSFPYKVWETDHFRIHYYEDNPLLLEETARYLEAAYADITERLDAKPNRKLPFFLYTNHNEFEQNRIVQVGEGTGGVTEAFKDRFLLFNNGSMAWLRHVIFHEFTHEVQFAVLNAGFWKSARLLKSILYPLWMMEGMAEYMSGEIDYVADGMYARDAATSKKAPAFDLKDLHNFNHLKPNQVTKAYKQGGMIMEFIAEEYGEEKLGEMLKSFWERFDVNAVLLDALGIDFDRFDRHFREWLEEKYGALAQGLDEPDRYGPALGPPEPPIPVFRMSPVMSADGKRLYYISLREGFPAIYEQDVEKKKRRILAGNQHGRLDWIALEHRNLSLDSEGRYLYFTGEKNLKDYLYRYDVQRGKLARRHFPDLIALQSPAADPRNSDVVALSGMENGFTDIYLVSFSEGKIVRRVTADPQDDNDPVWWPDGSALVYSTEVGFSSAAHPIRHLYRWSRDSNTAEPLTQGIHSNRYPAVSPEGERILFASDVSGVADLYELDLKKDKVERRTRVIGGVFSSGYCPDNQLFFSSFRHGEVNIYQGPRNGFLSEDVTSQFRPPKIRPRLPDPAVAARYKGPARSRFGTDLFFPAFFFSTQGGLFALGYWQGSDLLGYHNTAANLVLNTGQNALDYAVGYTYAGFRPDLSLVVRGRQYEDPFVVSDQGEDLRKREHLQAFVASYPLDRYHRVEGLVGVTERYHDFPNDPVALTNLQELQLTTRFIRDTATAPYLMFTRGSRLELGVTRAETTATFDLEYWTRFAEYHQYVPVGLDSAFASRLVAVRSSGRNHQVFPLGGRGAVRGYPQEGNNTQKDSVVTHTLEYRFPLFGDLNYHMWYMFPDFYFKNIYLGLFSDQGVRWTGHAKDLIDQWSVRRKDDFFHSVGVSLRFNTFILEMFPFFFSLDWAKRTTAEGNILYGNIATYFTFGSLNKAGKLVHEEK